MTAMRPIGIILASACCRWRRWPRRAALGQSREPISALKGHNSDAPVDVTADRIEVQDRADRAIFAGNVQVRQAELTLDTAAADRRLFEQRRECRSGASTRPAESIGATARRKPRAASSASTTSTAS